MQFKGADLTNSTQKSIAAIIGIAALVLLYFILPPIITIITNIWLAIGIGLPLAFLIYNYEILWTVFKRLSWNMTKKIISSDKHWYLYRYYEYVMEKIKTLEEHIKSVTAIKSSTTSRLKQLKADLEKETKQAIYHEEKGNATQLKISRNRVAILTGQIDTLVPKLEYIILQEKDMIQLKEIWLADSVIMKDNIDGKVAEYQLLKELSSASKSANSFLMKESPEWKNYNESLKQIDQSLAMYTADIENFSRNVMPTISRHNTEQDLLENEGMKLIEEYKQKRLAL